MSPTSDELLELERLKKQQELTNLVIGDFKVFLMLVWRHLNLPDPTPVQYDIADYLQDYTNNRKIVQAFRGVGKSWITSAYVCWILLRNPQAKVLVVSASKQRSDVLALIDGRSKRLLLQSFLFRGQLDNNPCYSTTYSLNTDFILLMISIQHVAHDVGSLLIPKMRL